MSECPVLVCARGTELTFTLPSKWMSRPFQQLVILPFIQTYNSHKERSGRLSSDDLLAVTSPLSLATLSRIEIDGTEVPLKAVHAPTSSIVEAHQRVDLTFGPSPEERRMGERRPSDGVPSASNLSLSIQSRINRLSDQDLASLSRRSPERRPRAIAPEPETTKTPHSTPPQKDVLPPETPASQQTMPETPASQLTLIAATSPEAATATPLKQSRKLFRRPETPASQQTLTGAGSPEPEPTPASNSSRTASRRTVRASFEPNPISGQFHERTDTSPPAPAETSKSQATPHSVLKKPAPTSAANPCEGCRANNYQVSSNVPKSEPTKRVDTVDIEELVSQTLSGEEIKFCRCYRSSRFPLCDGAHNAHNKEAGDNAGPIVIKSFPPSDKRPTLPPVAVISEAERSRGVVGKRANNYGIESNMPPNDPQRRVDILDVVAVSDCVTQKGLVKLCRCYKSATFPYCDGSHVEHNQKTGDNCGPLIIDASAVAAPPSSARTAPAPAAPVAQGKERVVPLAEVAVHDMPGKTTKEPVSVPSVADTPASNGCEGCRANNYQVSSNMPKSEPTKRVDTVDIEELVSQTLSGEEIKFCRCYRSSRFPLCDGAHNAHNKEAGDNAGPIVIKSFPPSDKRPTLPPVAVVSEAERSRGVVGKRANNYGIESNMPPNDPQRRVDILDVVAVSDCVTQKGMVKLCRCYKSATFPYCDGSHVEHNQKTGDNCGPLIIDASAVAAPPSSARTAPAPAAPVAQGKERVVPLAEVAVHNKPGDMWMVIHGVVYDLSDFAKAHPGGESILMQFAGKIADEGFDENHAESVITQNLPPEKRIGVLAPMEANSVPPVTPAAAESSPALSSEPAALAKKATVGPRPPIESCINLYDFELVARTYLKPSSYAYYATGSTDEFTKTGNQAIYRRIKLVPRVMIDVADVDLEVEVLGTRMSFPVYISGAAKGGVSGNPDAEVALCRAAYAAGVVQMAPHMPTKPHAEIAAARADGQTQWLQLYMETDRAASEKFVREAERLGFAALFVTVDSAGIGKRERDLRLTPGGSAPRSVATKRRWASDMTWEDLHWLRTLFTGKIVLKGVQCAADAVRAYREGADGIVISNHGGRNMDTARPSLEVLIEVMPALRREWGTAGDASMRCIAQCLPAPKPRPFEVLIDGGIMRGSDVYKAIALGAKAVGIGRAALWGLSAYGQQGTEQVLEILRNELFTTMQMMGKTHLHQLAADSLAGVDEAVRGAAWADSASRDHLPPLALE